MPGRWKAWKTKGRFSTLPTAPWKSRKPGEIPTFPHALRDYDYALAFHKTKEEGRRIPRSSAVKTVSKLSGSSTIGNRCRFQAHLWIGKCSLAAREVGHARDRDAGRRSRGRAPVRAFFTPML